MATVIGWSIDDLKMFVNFKRKDQSIRSVAKQIGISPTTFCKIENGHMPDMKTLQKVLNWLGYDLSFYSAKDNPSFSGKGRRASSERF